VQSGRWLGVGLSQPWPFCPGHLSCVFRACLLWDANCLLTGRSYLLMPRGVDFRVLCEGGSGVGWRGRGEVYL
jgi:hypothetical protein